MAKNVYLKIPNFLNVILACFYLLGFEFAFSSKPLKRKKERVYISTTLPLILPSDTLKGGKSSSRSQLRRINIEGNFSWKFPSRPRDRRNKRRQAVQTHSPDRTQFVQIWDTQRQPCRRQTGCRVPFPPPGRDRSGCACQAGDTTAVHNKNVRNFEKG